MRVRFVLAVFVVLAIAAVAAAQTTTGNNFRTSARRAGSGPARRDRHRTVAEPARVPRGGDVGEWRLHPDGITLGPLHDHFLARRIPDPDAERRAGADSGPAARGYARSGAGHRGGDRRRELGRHADEDRADCHELLPGTDREPADVARPQLDPADGAGRSSHGAGGRVLVRRLGELRESLPPQRRQHQREHPRAGLRYGDRRRDPGNDRRQRRRLRRVRPVQRRRGQHHHQVGRQPVLGKPPPVAQQRQVADADAVRDRAPDDDARASDRQGRPDLRVHDRRPGDARPALVLHVGPSARRVAGPDADCHRGTVRVHGGTAALRRQGHVSPSIRNTASR